MNQNSSTASSKLKALASEKKRPRSSRTAFKLLPKVSCLFDWMLKSTELSASALFRTELEFTSESDVDISLFWSVLILDVELTQKEKQEFNAFRKAWIDRLETLSLDESGEKPPRLPSDVRSDMLSRVKPNISKNGVRRSMAIERNQIQQIERIAKECGTSRDVCVNLLIINWARDWRDSLEIDISDADLKAKCAEEVYNILEPPDWGKLKKKFKISDERFWKDLEVRWDGAAQFFYDMAMELVPTGSPNCLKQYDDIVGKGR